MRIPTQTRLIIGLLVFVLLMGGGLGILRLAAKKETTTPVTDSSREKPGLAPQAQSAKNPLAPNSLQFNLDPRVSAPRTMPVFNLKPAPFDLFSPQGIQGLAQALGFTSQAAAKTFGKLVTYNQGKRHLTINTQAGTIRLTVDLESLSQKTGPISAEQAKDLVDEKLRPFGLSGGLLDWKKAAVANYTVRGGAPAQTSLASQLNFIQLTLQPKIDFEKSSFDLLLPFPAFAWVGPNQEIVGLSIWYPNIQSQNPISKPLINLEEAERKILKGEGFLKSQSKGLDRLTLTGFEIVYQVLPNEIQDFSQPRFLRPFYRFYGEGGEVLAEAIE